eukprot:5071606-Pyramimonas_sp.AAC.1
MKRIALIERSGSADRTAIEHLDRSIGVVRSVSGPRFTISVVRITKLFAIYGHNVQMNTSIA